MAVGLVGGVVVPEAPDDAQPGAAEDADRVRVVAAAGDRVGVDLLCPGVVLAAAVGEDAEGVAQRFVAGPAEAGDLFLPDSIATGLWPARASSRARVS